jgi:hypothetical protein
MECYTFKEEKIPMPVGDKLKRFEERIAAHKKMKASKPHKAK